MEIMEKKKKEVSCLQELLLRHVLSTLRMQATSWDRNPIPTAVVTTANCVLWLRTSRDRAVAAQESWAASASGFQVPVHGLAGAPHLTSCAARALVQLSTKCCWCCRGLSDHLSLPSVDISRLRWKLTSNLLSESVFWCLLPSGGEEILFLAPLEQSACLTRHMAPCGPWQRAASVERAEGAGSQWHFLSFTERQHIGVFKLCLKAFFKREPSLKVKL